MIDLRQSLVLFLALASCGTVPTPTPTPVDIFAAKVFDCQSPAVASEEGSTEPEVSACLDGRAFDPTACLVGISSQASLDTIACAVRAQGASASARIAAGVASDSDKATAINARAWLRGERVSFK